MHCDQATGMIVCWWWLIKASFLPSWSLQDCRILEDQTTQNSSTSLSLSMEAQSKSTKFTNWVWKMEQNNKRIGLGLGLLALQDFSQGFSLFLLIHKLSTIMQNMRLFLPMCLTSMSWFDPPNFKNEQQWDRQLSDAAVYKTMHELSAKGLRTCLKNYCLVDPAAKMVPAVPANSKQNATMEINLSWKKH